jgi:hypothetical protein
MEASANDAPNVASRMASRPDTANGSVTSQPSTNSRNADTAPAQTTGVSRKARTMIM